ncbi:MAG: hypothetical protein ACH346_01495, partial [Chthoniobacterales bacterium]
QYAQPQNDFSTGSRTFQVCFAVLKIIFRPSLYANLLTPITVFRWVNGCLDCCVGIKNRFAILNHKAINYCF